MYMEDKVFLAECTGLGSRVYATISQISFSAGSPLSYYGDRFKATFAPNIPISKCLVLSGDFGHLSYVNETAPLGSLDMGLYHTDAIFDDYCEIVYPNMDVALRPVDFMTMQPVGWTRHRFEPKADAPHGPPRPEHLHDANTQPTVSLLRRVQPDGAWTQELSVSLPAAALGQGAPTHLEVPGTALTPDDNGFEYPLGGPDLHAIEIDIAKQPTVVTLPVTQALQERVYDQQEMCGTAPRHIKVHTAPDELERFLRWSANDPDLVHIPMPEDNVEAFRLGTRQMVMFQNTTPFQQITEHQHYFLCDRCDKRCPTMYRGTTYHVIEDTRPWGVLRLAGEGTTIDNRLSASVALVYANGSRRTLGTALLTDGSQASLDGFSLSLSGLDTSAPFVSQHSALQESAFLAPLDAPGDTWRMGTEWVRVPAAKLGTSCGALGRVSLGALMAQNGRCDQPLGSCVKESLVDLRGTAGQLGISDRLQELRLEAGNTQARATMAPQQAAHAVFTLPSTLFAGTPEPVLTSNMAVWSVVPSTAPFHEHEARLVVRLNRTEPYPASLRVRIGMACNSIPGWVALEQDAILAAGEPVSTFDVSFALPRTPAVQLPANMSYTCRADLEILQSTAWTPTNKEASAVIVLETMYGRFVPPGELKRPIPSIGLPSPAESSALRQMRRVSAWSANTSMAAGHINATLQHLKTVFAKVDDPQGAVPAGLVSPYPYELCKVVVRIRNNSSRTWPFNASALASGTVPASVSPAASLQYSVPAGSLVTLSFELRLFPYGGPNATNSNAFPLINLLRHALPPTHNVSSIPPRTAEPLPLARVARPNPTLVSSAALLRPSARAVSLLCSAPVSSVRRQSPLHAELAIPGEDPVQHAPTPVPRASPHAAHARRAARGTSTRRPLDAPQGRRLSPVAASTNTQDTSASLSGAAQVSIALVLAIAKAPVDEVWPAIPPVTDTLRLSLSTCVPDPPPTPTPTPQVTPPALAVPIFAPIVAGASVLFGALIAIVILSRILAHRVGQVGLPPRIDVLTPAVLDAVPIADLQALPEGAYHHEEIVSRASFEEPHMPGCGPLLLIAVRPRLNGHMFETATMSQVARNEGFLEGFVVRERNSLGCAIPIAIHQARLAFYHRSLYVRSKGTSRGNTRPAYRIESYWGDATESTFWSRVPRSIALQVHQDRAEEQTREAGAAAGFIPEDEEEEEEAGRRPLPPPVESSELPFPHTMVLTQPDESARASACGEEEEDPSEGTPFAPTSALPSAFIESVSLDDFALGADMDLEDIAPLPLPEGASEYIPCLLGSSGESVDSDDLSGESSRFDPLLTPTSSPLGMLPSEISPLSPSATPLDFQMTAPMLSTTEPPMAPILEPIDDDH